MDTAPTSVPPLAGMDPSRPPSHPMFGVGIALERAQRARQERSPWLWCCVEREREREHDQHGGKHSRQSKPPRTKHTATVPQAPAPRHTHGPAKR